MRVYTNLFSYFFTKIMTILVTEVMVVSMLIVGVEVFMTEVVEAVEVVMIEVREHLNNH